MIWLESSVFSTSALNVFGECLLDQYVSTKESWMADYCKQDKEIESTSSEDWMGSSVDPPCFGQSKNFLYKYLTKPLLTYKAMFHWENQIEPSFSMEKPTGNSVYCSSILVFARDIFLAQNTELVV